MARDLNKVQLTGRLGADPTMRRTAHGSAIATFRVASNRSWRSSSGAAHEETEWFRVVAWDQLADLCEQSLVKGAHIYIEGRLQTRQWAEADGRTRANTEVIASEIILLSDSGEPPAEAAEPPAMAAAPPTRRRRTRAAAHSADLDPARSPRQALAIGEEDLPI
jgi:single-strand DNA-binding protein